MRKLLGAFTKSNTGKFVELAKGVTLEDHLGGDPSKHFFYLEVSGLRTANGRQKIKFVYVIEQGQGFDM